MSIALKDVSLSVLQGGKQLRVIENTNLTIPKRNMALIGESRVAVVAMLDLLCRRLIPQRGAIHFGGTVSWPIGRTGPFSVATTGTQAISHFATVYGFDRNQGLAFMTAEFAAPELFTEPLARWPAAMKIQFFMLMAMMPAFDVYLIDSSFVMPENVAFTRRFLELYNLRCREKTTLITARQTKVLHALCDSALVIADGMAYLEDNLEAALAVSNKKTLEVVMEEDRIETIDDGIIF